MLEAGGTLLWKAVAAAAVQADTGNLSLSVLLTTESCVMVPTWLDLRSQFNHIVLCSSHTQTHTLLQGFGHYLITCQGQGAKLETQLTGIL